MEILDLHARLAQVPAADRGKWFPGQFLIETPQGRADAWPAAVCAAIVCTGWLPSLETDQDVREAVAQARMLLSSDTITPEAMEEEFWQVVEAVIAWGIEHEHEPVACRGGA